MTKVQPYTPIPYGRQTVGAEEIDAVTQVLKGEFITQGPAISAFESAVADYCQVPYAVAFANGTAALHGAYVAAGLSAGDEAITSPLTFLATSNAMVFCGATPVFADIDPTTWNLSPEATQQALTPKTKALVPVHFAGQPVDLAAFYALADQHNLVVIEDACHALGGTYQQKPIGACRDMAVFSFHPVKSITTGEGGMVVTPHKHLYEKLLAFRSHGMVRDAAKFETLTPDPWVYEMQTLGYNYRMTDMQAAMGRAQMQKLSGFIAQREMLSQRYEAALASDPRVILQHPEPCGTSARHLFAIRINPQETRVSRREVYDHLVAANIRPQVHYLPVHLQPYYRNTFGTVPGQFPNAESYYETCLSLPLYPSLSLDDQDFVIAQLSKALG